MRHIAGVRQNRRLARRSRLPKIEDAAHKDLKTQRKVFHSKIVPFVTYDLAIHSAQNRTMDGVRIRTAEAPEEAGSVF